MADIRRGRTILDPRSPLSGTPTACWRSELYSSRSAEMTSSRTARSAGNMPPKRPMASVIAMATAMTSGPKRNATVTEAKLLKSLVS